MAVRIRMKKFGRTHRPFFRICVMDSRVPRDGNAIEELGSYDPMVREKSERVKLDMERVDYWISVGAKPTEKVAVLINKVRENRWGSVKEPPPMTAPKPAAPEPEPEPEAEAAEGEAAEATEEAVAEEAES